MSVFVTCSAFYGCVPRSGVGVLWVSSPLQRPPRVWRRWATYPQRWSSGIFGRVWLPNLYQTGEPTMTDEMMSLRTLLEKSADADLLREMVGFAAQRLMELEVESLTGAAHGQRRPDRINHRNGYRV